MTHQTIYFVVWFQKNALVFLSLFTFRLKIDEERERERERESENSLTSLLYYWLSEGRRHTRESICSMFTHVYKHIHIHRHKVFIIFFCTSRSDACEEIVYTLIIECTKKRTKNWQCRCVSMYASSHIGRRSFSLSFLSLDVGVHASTFNWSFSLSDIQSRRAYQNN